MVFLSDRFIFDGIRSEDMGVRLVTTNDNGVLTDYGVAFDEEIKVEHTFGTNPFFTHKQNVPEKVTLEFCLVDKTGDAIRWDREIEEKVVNWLMKKKFCEFISFDYPELIFYFRGVKASRRMTSKKEGVLVIEFQPYYKHPIQKFKKYIVSNGEKTVTLDNPYEFKEYVYPIIEVDALEDGNVEIENLTAAEGKPLIISNLKKGEKILIDNQMFLATDGGEKNMFPKINRVWFKLAKGYNSIKVYGKAKVKIYFNVEVRI